MKLLVSAVSILIFVVLVPIAKAKYALNSDSTFWNVNPFTDKRSMGDSYTSLCEEGKKHILLDDGIHIYRPNWYTEVLCLNEQNSGSGQQICTDLLKLNCVQLYSTITIVRATVENATKNCWQYETKEIPLGCSCMKSSDIEDS